MMHTPRIIALLFVSCLFVHIVPGQSSSRANEHWVATWATAQDLGTSVPDPPQVPPNIKMPDFSKFKGMMPHAPEQIANQTIRMIVHPAIPGHRVRIELANAFGKSAVSIGAVHLAIRTKDSSIDPGSDRQLTFGGNSSVVIRPGVVMVSDPADFEFREMEDLAVSIYVVASEGTPTNHMIGLHTTYISSGDTTAAPSMPQPSTTLSYLWLRSVDVVAQPQDFAIVCLGDSITDGFATTVDKDQAWPALLAKRLSERKSGPKVAVLNEGISGNQVLRDGAGLSAMARLDRDVLSEPGVRWIVLLEGINDINTHGQITGSGALVADDLIQGYRQIIARAHLSNIKVMGATLTPEEGVWLAGPAGEATRQKVNEWIRTSGEFDAIVDLDAVLRDNEHPSRLREEFNPGDHIHPNNIGNAAMADAFQLNVFEN